MRLFTSVSDKVFLVTLLLSAAILAYVFYCIAEGFSETMLMEKNNWRMDVLKIEASQSQFALLGTSHADSHSMPEGANYTKLTGGHNLPPAMYFETKSLLKHPTTIKVAYIEADDHLFMNGSSYNVKISSEKNTEKNYMYENWNYYFDEEGKKAFGSNSKKPGLMDIVFLQPDIKPILLKRMSNKLFFNVSSDKNPGGTAAPMDICKAYKTPEEPDISGETYWSHLTSEERENEVTARVKGFALKQPSPISPLMTEYYEKTIQLFLNHGIQVVLVRFPMSSEFKNGVHPDNTAAISKYLGELRQKHNLPLVDMGYMSKYGEKFFSNGDHADKKFFPLIGQLIINDFCTNRQ
jgi:hypothetical protein